MNTDHLTIACPSCHGAGEGECLINGIVHTAECDVCQGARFIKGEELDLWLVGQAWRWMRIQEGETLRACAVKLGISPTQLSYAEQGKAEPRRQFLDTCRCAHVRSAVRRKSQPGIRHWKNGFLSLVERVPLADQLADDWEEYDPREHEECAEFDETPA